jgi:hypothetical protein
MLKHTPLELISKLLLQDQRPYQTGKSVYEFRQKSLDFVPHLWQHKELCPQHQSTLHKTVQMLGKMPRQTMR